MLLTLHEMVFIKNEAVFTIRNYKWVYKGICSCLICFICLTCHRCLKGFYANKLIVLWKTSFHLTLRGFRKNRNAQYSLLNMIENWSKQLDNGEKVGVIFIDLLKSFDTTNCSLLMAKLKTYGFPDQVYYKVAYVTDFREA